MKPRVVEFHESEGTVIVRHVRNSGQKQYYELQSVPRGARLCIIKDYVLRALGLKK